jgi:hypothetical protein
MRHYLSDLVHAARTLSGWVRLTDPSWYPLGGVEPLVYSAAAATSFLVAVLAGIRPPGVRPRSQAMVAMRAE